VARRDPTHIVMVGTSLETRGGIASLVNAYRAAGLFARWPIEYVETHCDGTRVAKLACALGAFCTFLRLVLRHRRAVLHVHSASRASFWRKSAFMALAQLAGWPIVFHLHGGGFARFYEDECGPMGKYLVRHFLDRAASIIVVAERWGVWIRSVSANPRVRCIANAVAVPAAAPPERNGALVTFVGRCEASKGIYELLDAVNEVREAIPSVRLECAGDGELAAVARRAAELGMRAHLHLPGWISRGRREDLIRRTTVFVLPSHAEGLPMSLLEAMAAGCPVIASRVGGIPDLVTDGVNGLLVPPGDRGALALALHRLLVDRGLAARLGREARATIMRRYTVEQAVERLEQVYAGLGVSRAPVRAEGTGHIRPRTLNHPRETS
jgi:glycosyltransferase involved in cell wall biosynthesis